MSNLFNADFLEFLALLNRHQVKYLVCGGFAVIIYGHHRSTGDVDVWVEKTEANYGRLRLAFQDFGLPQFDMTVSNFLGDSFDVFSFGRPPVAIDIMTSLKGVNFDEAFDLAGTYMEGEIPIRVIHRNHLIQAKISSGRPKDIDDVNNIS